MSNWNHLDAAEGTIDEMSAQITRLTKQRDELREALEDMLEAFSLDDDFRLRPGKVRLYAKKKARQALANLNKTDPET